MVRILSDEELEKKIKIKPHDYGRDIERLDQKIKREQFAYLDAIKSRLNKAKNRALALSAAGVLILIASLFFSNYFPQYDEAAYFFLEDYLLLGTMNPVISFIGLMVPAAIVFAFLVWLHKRETRFWVYMTRKAQERKKKSRFFITIAEPFFMLVTGMMCGVAVLFIFSLLGCEYFFCTFYERTFYFSSNLLFNLLALSFYLIILGTVQFKRYLSLVRLGIKAVYESMEL